MRWIRPPADISAQYRAIRVGKKKLSLLILKGESSQQIHRFPASSGSTEADT